MGEDELNGGALRVTRMGALAFQDVSLEERYRAFHLQETIPQTQLLAFFACIAALIYMPIDKYYLSDTALEFVYHARIFCLAPIAISWVILGFYLRARPESYYRWIELSSFPALFIFPAMIFLSEGSAMLYGGVAQTQIIVFLTILLRMPMGYVVPMTGIALIVMLAVIASFDVPLSESLLAYIPVASVGILTLAVAYRMDFDSRKAFVTRATYLELVERERASEQDRLAWLENLSRFLKHEFRNAILGVSLSLSRMEQNTDPILLPRYIERARRSLDFMRQLLAQTADAATIASALSLDSPEIFDLSELAQNRVTEYQSIYPDNDFELDVSVNCTIEGEEIRVTQLIDKLVSNAVEHGNVKIPIEVKVNRLDQRISLVVENRGDPLSAGIDELSELFRTTKSRSNNLGLGLYVASRIMKFHRGFLDAESLFNPTGARFIASFPAAKMPNGNEEY